MDVQALIFDDFCSGPAGRDAHLCELVAEVGMHRSRLSDIG